MAKVMQRIRRKGLLDTIALSWHVGKGLIDVD